MQFLGDVDIKEAIEHCWDRKDYPEVFRDDAGLDISIPGFITRGSWNRDFYDVEADTIEEAVEKVRYGEVDCYDSEQIYEVIDELDPVDNNGSPTREIYNDKDELMWHNAELVNRGEIITQSIRSISENLSLIMEGEPELFRGGDIAFSTARRVMEMLGWKCSYAGKATLGQDAYYCIICTKPDKDFKYKIFGNAYEGSISKEKL